MPEIIQMKLQKRKDDKIDGINRRDTIWLLIELSIIEPAGEISSILPEGLWQLSYWRGLL